MSDQSKKAIVSVLWRGGLTLLQFILNVSLVILLMRYISPTDYGLIGKVYILLGLFGVFLDFGFSQAIIQNSLSSKSFLSSHAILSTIIGFSLALTMLLLAGTIAKYYQEPLLKPLLYIVSFTIAIGGLTMIPRAYMQKTLQFKELSIINFVAFIISGIVALILAIKGLGYQALIVQLILLSLIQFLLIMRFSKMPFQWVINRHHIKSTFNFSKFIFLDKVVNYASVTLDQFLTSIYFSSVTFGNYNRALSLSVTPFRIIPSVISSVLFPLFSKNETTGQYSSTDLYVKLSALIYHLILPLILLLTIYNSLYLDLILNEEWTELKTYVKYAWVICAFLILNLEGPLLLAKGKSKWILGVNTILRVLRIVTILISITYGIIFLLKALIVLEVISRMVKIYSTSLVVDIDYKMYFNSIFVSLLYMATFIAIVYFLTLLSDSTFFTISLHVLLYLAFVLVTYKYKLGAAGKFLHKIVKILV